MTKRIVVLIIVFFMCIGTNMYWYKTYGTTASTGVTSGIGDAIKDALDEAITNTQNVNKGDTVDSTMAGAQDFLAEGKDRRVDGELLKDTSNFLFNLLLAIAMVLAVIIGIVIGIQFIVASVEEKAKVKEELLPYFAGCGVVFGAFGIWKLAVTILSSW